MTIQLRDGSTVLDPRLDRLVQFDERSRNFPITAALPSTELRSRSWPCHIYLDQGREGACVGFSWAHALATTSRRKKGVTGDFAFHQIYKPAQLIDPWEGEDYEGTSVLAGAQVLHQRGLIESYRWAFGIDDVLATLSNHGPVILGIPWRDSMYDPNDEGLLDVTGNVVGGHAIMARGHIIRRRFRGGVIKHVVRLRNSWNKDWGINGDCFIEVSDLDRELRNGGEACVPVGTKTSMLALAA